MNEREAKLKAVYNVLVDNFWSNRFPSDFNKQAEEILMAIEQVELDREYAS